MVTGAPTIALRPRTACSRGLKFSLRNEDAVSNENRILSVVVCACELPICISFCGDIAIRKGGDGFLCTVPVEEFPGYGRICAGCLTFQFPTSLRAAEGGGLGGASR